MKKRSLLSILVICLCLILVGCSGENSKENKKEDKKENKNEAQITEQVIYEKNDIKVIAKSIEYDGYIGPSIKLYVENNSSKDITVQCDIFSINDLMINTIFSMDVAKGKKANDELFISKEELEISKIDTFKEIEFDIEIIDPNTWDTIDTKKNVVLETDATSYVQKYEPEGKLVLELNGVKIYAEKVDTKNSVWGMDVYFYVENNSNDNVTIQAEDVSVNGYMIDPTFSVDLPVGKKAYTSMSFFEEDLKDNDIKSIEEIELVFDVWHMDTWDDLFKSKTIKIEF